MRPVRAVERAAVRDLVREAYREFEAALAPEYAARMVSNLAAVVERAAEHELLVAELSGALVGTVTYLAPEHPATTTPRRTGQ